MVINRFNLRTIQADVVFKQADPWDKDGQWTVAIKHYERAKAMIPWEQEDFYYLYLGRAWLEYASSIQDTAQQDLALRETEQVLLQAQVISPLNTDHSANMARMYRRWANLPAGRDNSRALSELASQYYDVATTLSPQNSILWNEWASLYYYNLRDEDGFQEKIDHSLELDAEFEQTWLIIADVRASQGDMEGAVEAYQTALDINPRQRNVWVALGQAYLQLNRSDEAIAAIGQAISMAPNANNVWDMRRLLAIGYYQNGDIEQAIAEAELGLQLAPDEQKQLMEQLLQQLQAVQSQPPEDTTP